MPPLARTSASPALDCAWCGRRLDEPDPRRRGRRACPACGAQTIYPWPTDAELDEAYAGWYRPAGGRFAGFGDRVLRAARARLAGRVDALAPAGPVLDVGAGDGALLDALHARGREATGLERDASRPDMRAGGVEDVEDGWAAIVFWHSLEHLPAPGAALAAAAERLRPGGLLFVALPNAASLQARAFGDRWFALDPPRHLVHVPAPTLLATVRGHGLRVQRVSYARGGQVVFGWLHGLVGSLPGRPDLYDALRRPEARRTPMTPGRRALVLGAATALWPAAVAAAAVEVAARRGGSVYVEARRD